MARSIDKVPYKFRIVHWIYAHVLGYFWEECTNCFRSFGGHESGPGMLGAYSGFMTCRHPECVRIMGSRNESFLASDQFRDQIAELYENRA